MNYNTETIESNSTRNVFLCEFNECNREFNSKRNLVDHCRGHHQGNKPHPCTFQSCGKSFLRPAHLLIHTRIHTGEKPFVCEYQGCGKRWNQKSALKQHLRSHTGEKPFRCSIRGCSKSFSTSSSCKRHITTHYSKSYEKKSQDWNGNFSPINSPCQSSSSSSDEEIERDADSILPIFRSFVQRNEAPLVAKMTVNFLIN